MRVLTHDFLTKLKITTGRLLNSEVFLFTQKTRVQPLCKQTLKAAHSDEK